MHFGLVLPTVGTEWSQTLEWAVAAEDGGFDSIWVVDHLMSTPPGSSILEAWTVLSALATVTKKVKLGAQVFCSSFRPPGLFAKMVCTLDFISGGRVKVLVGAGWNQAEHRGFGIPFPPAPTRVSQLEEVVTICRGMWGANGQPFSYDGPTWSLDSATNLPFPDRAIEIGIGGSGNLLLGLAARAADEWNCPAERLPEYDRLSSYLAMRCQETGRVVRRSIQLIFNPGNRPVLGRRASFHPELGLNGMPKDMVAAALRWRDKGVEGLYGYVMDRNGLDQMVSLLPELRAAAL